MAFNTQEESTAAIDADPQKQFAAAVQIAREYFDSGKVLGSLIERARMA